MIDCVCEELWMCSVLYNYVYLMCYFVIFKKFFKVRLKENFSI